MSAAGDVNGDGFDDLIIGARRRSQRLAIPERATWSLAKRAGLRPNLNLSTLDGSNGFKLSGAG